ncbi:MAG: hypothetical protein AB7L91_06280 [Dehalococcoidia bacterium]
MGDPVAVRLGPGNLYMAAIGTPEPTDLASPWNVGFVPLGYTDEGSSVVFNNTFENVNVAEELEPIYVLQTMREINVNFALAELTALNLQRAFNGGDVVTAGGLVTFEPPDAGEYTPVMLGWESDDGLERWVFRKCMQVGTVEIARRKAPVKATLPMTFRCTKPSGEAAFLFIQSEDYDELGS